ncbi:MAG: hypothetical protein ACKODX_12030, partial [Gemmata sp.]
VTPATNTISKAGISAFGDFTAGETSSMGCNTTITIGSNANRSRSALCMGYITVQSDRADGSRRETFNALVAASLPIDAKTAGWCRVSETNWGQNNLGCSW